MPGVAVMVGLIATVGFCMSHLCVGVEATNCLAICIHTCSRLILDV